MTYDKIIETWRKVTETMAMVAAMPDDATDEQAHDRVLAIGRALLDAKPVLDAVRDAGPGAWAVLQERARQQTAMQFGGEAISRMHDAEHNRAGELGLAATSYIAAAISKPSVRRQYRDRMHEGAVRHPMTGMWPVWTWPVAWDAEAFKMGKGDTEHERIRELEKAGALVAAEIDRRSAL